MKVSFNRLLKVLAPNLPIENISINMYNKDISVIDIENYIKADKAEFEETQGTEIAEFFKLIADYCMDEKIYTVNYKESIPLLLMSIIDIDIAKVELISIKKGVAIYEDTVHTLLAHLYNYWKFPYLVDEDIEISNNSLLRLNVLSYLCGEQDTIYVSSKGYNEDFKLIKEDN